MAFKKVGGRSQAFTIDKTNKKFPNNRPVVTGFVLGVKKLTNTFGKGKNKEERTSYIYNLCDEKGSPIAVWGGGVINSTLLSEKGLLLPAFKEKLVRFTYKGLLPKKPGQNAGRNIEIELDEDAKLPKGAGRIKF